MPYTNPWSVTVPAGSEPANTIDEHFRRLRLDLQERLLEVFTAMPTNTNPLVVKDEIRGVKNGKHIHIPFCAFVPDQFDDAVEYNGSDAGDDPHVVVGASAGPVRAPVILPPGVTVKRIRWHVSNDDATQITFKLLAANFAVGAVVQEVNAMTLGGTGEQILDSGLITYIVPDNRYFYLWAEKSGGSAFHIHSVQIEYNTPDSRSTI